MGYSLIALLSVLYVIPGGGQGQPLPPRPPPPTINVTITPSGSNTAGETYSLVCSVTVTGHGSTDTPTITWLDPMDSQVPSEMVSTIGSMSTLTFNPLSVSHAGYYACIARLRDGDGMNQAIVTIQSECVS